MVAVLHVAPRTAAVEARETACEQTEARLREAEEQLRVFFESATAAVAMFDLKAVLTPVSFLLPSSNPDHQLPMFDW